MLFNSQRITKSAIKELSKKNKLSEDQNILNNKQKLIDLREKEKMKNLLIVKYMKKCGIKKPQLFLEDEISHFMKGEKLKKIDIEKMNNKMKEIINKQKPKKKIIKSPTTIFTENKLPEIDPSSTLKRKEKIFLHPIHSSLSTGNLITTTSQPVKGPIPTQNPQNIDKNDINPENNNNNQNELNTISTNIKRKKKLFIKPEEEIAELEKELGLDENTQKLKKRGYERLFKFFSEGNEWEAIVKYNKDLYDQEIEEEKRRKFENKIRLRKDLEKQIKEKVKRDYADSLEEKKYKQIFNEHNKQMEKIENEEKDIIHRRLLLEKKAQAEQIKTRKIKERLEMLREKKFDKNTIEAVKEELEKEKQYLKEKKLKETEQIRKDMKEAEENIKLKHEKIKKSKEEDKIFCQDLEKSEILKEMERQKILERMRNVRHYKENPNVKKIIEKNKKRRRRRR